MKEIFEKNFDKTILFSSGIIMIIGVSAFLIDSSRVPDLSKLNLINYLVLLYQSHYWKKDKNYRVKYLVYCIVILVVLYICYIKFALMFLYRVPYERGVYAIRMIRMTDLIISPFIKSWFYQYFKQKSYKHVEETKKEE